MLPASVWEKVDKNGPVPVHRPELGPCWLWLGWKNEKGYGRHRVGRQQRKVHRSVYEELVGPIPEGLEPDHLCRIRHCCNPAHQELVTHAENVRRGRSGSPQSERTTCPAGHAYDESNTRWSTRSGGRRYRVCRACQRDWYHNNKSRSTMQP